MSATSGTFTQRRASSARISRRLSASVIEGDGDANDLAAGGGQLLDLVRGRQGVAGVAGGHRLDADRVVAADTDVPDPHLASQAASAHERVAGEGIAGIGGAGENHRENSCRSALLASLDQLVETLDGCVDLGGIAAACLSEVRATSPSSSDDSSNVADQITGPMRRHEVLGDADRQQYLAPTLRDDEHHAAPEAAAQFVHQGAHPGGIDSVDPNSQHLLAANLAHLRQEISGVLTALRLLQPIHLSDP